MYIYVYVERSGFIAVCVLLKMWEIVSIITAMEESDGQDSSVVWRPIVIMSNERRNPSVDLWNGKGLKGKMALLGIEPRATSALPLSYDARRQPPPFLARVLFPVAPLSFQALAVSKIYGQWRPRLHLSLDMITIGSWIRTTEESCPLDSSIAVIMLTISHIFMYVYVPWFTSMLRYPSLIQNGSCSCNRCHALWKSRHWGAYKYAFKALRECSIIVKMWTCSYHFI